MVLILATRVEHFSLICDTSSVIKYEKSRETF